MVTWVLQTNLISADHRIMLSDALREQGTPVLEVEVVPFSDELECGPLSGKVIPYGSTKLQRLGRKYGWNVFFDERTFRADVWNRERDDMLNADLEVFKVRDALPYLLSRQDELFFTRPVEDFKAYTGATLAGHEIYGWLSNTLRQELYNFHEDTEIVLAPPKKILAEWRWFVVNRQVVTGSTYRIRGNRLTKQERDPEVIAEAQRFADKWLPHETVVMDLALTEEDVKVVEFNCLNAAGFYYHDVKAIAREVTRYVEAL